ncbi:MAG: c-type cytochrome [Saprospiraceae bacterium]|nr:c-type cytochrome [Saprospiraceae bacterium]
MKKGMVVGLFYGLVLLMGTMNYISCAKKITPEASATTASPPAPPATPNPPTAPATASAPSQPPQEPPFVAAIKEKIKGKEDLPAEEVFENIKVMKGVKAGNILPIMMEGFNKSLGVRCSHCHARGNWASDDNPKKQVAREMWEMTGKINKELLTSIKNLESAQPAIACATCHRGKAIPKVE